MMARTHGDAFLIEQGGQIMRMHAIDQEGDHRHLFARLADDAQAGNRAHRFGGMDEQFVFTRGHALEADRLDVIERRTEADKAGDVRRAGFELVRRIGKRGALEAHFTDHLAAAEEWRHRIKVRTACPEHAGTGWPEQLVSGQGVEIATQRAHVDAQMWRGLRAIDQQRNAALAAFAGELGNGVDGAKHVGYMGDGGKPDLGRQQFDEALDNQFAGIADWRNLEFRAGSFANQLPRHDVGVVLHLRDEDRVAGFQARQRVTVGDQVDRLGRARGEDDFIARWRIDETRKLVAACLEGAGRLIAERMHGAGDVGIGLPVEMIDRFDDADRLLRGVGVVEIDQRLAMHPA